MESFDDPGAVDQVVAAILQKMRDKAYHIATAESCTGGLVAAALTAVAGSSDVVVGGVVAYANGVKEALLGVPADVLTRHGAVSAPVAEAMARGAAERLGASHAVSLTGIAGPGGGTPGKPVGTVYCGIHGPAGTRHCRWLFAGDRAAVRRQSVLGALHELKREVGA